MKLCRSPITAWLSSDWTLDFLKLLCNALFENSVCRESRIDYSNITPSQLQQTQSVLSLRSIAVVREYDARRFIARSPPPTVTSFPVNNLGARYILKRSDGCLTEAFPLEHDDYPT